MTSFIFRLALVVWVAASAAVLPAPLRPIVVVAAVGLGTAFVCWGANRVRLGDIVAFTTAVWLLPSWIAVDALSPEFRAVAVAASIASLPLLLHALIGRARILVLFDAVIGVVIVLRVAWFDPFIDRRCALLCDPSSLAVAATSASEGVVRAIDAWVPVLVALAGVVLARRRSPRLSVVLASTALFATMVARALAIYLETTDDPTLTWNRVALVIAVSATVAALCVAAWPAVRTLRARRAVARIVRRLGDDVRGVGNIQETLAVATGNKSLCVAYPRGAEWIDARGEPAPTPEPGASEIRVAGETIATISGLTDAAALGPAVQLGIANERLRAGVLAEIADLRSSRERIVEAGDAERRTLERNLHDGAQQGLVALSFALRRARAQASSLEAVDLDRAIVQTDRALAELRQVAHGIFPALLAEAGLETALHALADSSDASVLVTCSLLERPAPEVEMAAYRVAAEAVERAVAAAGGRELEISITLDRDLHVRVVGEEGGEPAADADGLADAADRVTALGGTIAVRQTASSTTVVEAVIPCAS